MILSFWITSVIYINIILGVSIAMYFDIVKRRIPHFIFLFILFIFGSTLIFLWGDNKILFGEVIGFLFILFWTYSVGILNAAYSKLLFCLGIFFMLLWKEWVFLANFFVLVLWYLIGHSCYVYFRLFLSKEHRKVVKEYFAGRMGKISNVFGFLGAIILIVLISILFSPIIQQVAIIAWRSFFGNPNASAIFIWQLFFFSIFWYMISWKIFQIPHILRMRNIGILLGILCIFGLLIDYIFPEYLTNRNLQYGLIGSLWGFILRGILILSIQISEKKGIHFEQLTNHFIIDIDFLKKRFDIEDVDMSAENYISQIQERIRQQISQNPTLPSEVIVSDRFLITPFVLWACVCTMLEIHLGNILLAHIS